MTKADQPFLVRRTCTRKSGSTDEQGSHLLESYRDFPAYVLLGDPGAGKTKAFEREANESGGEYIKARDFATFDPKEEYQDKTLFIDALDEMRADGGDGKTPLDHIRKHLERIGRPRFRLSCREADWLGESDSTALKQVSPNSDVVALHLDPLTDDDVIAILRHKTTVPDPEEFVRKAGEHRLNELLRNPQTLNLLVDAVGGNKWPRNREAVYEMACRKLVDEKNPEHRHAKREKHHSPDTLLDAAGYLCAIHLLSGIAGFALDEDVADSQHFNWKKLNVHGLPLFSVLRSGLFQQGGEQRLIPVHRSVAEYLGARYLAELVENRGLPFGRILALVTSEDGGVVPDLRGLAAWLSVHCRSGRSALIERDPLGVVLYGDVGNFPVADKQLVLTALKNEAQRYLWFRSEDWSSSSFGALATMDMEPAFREILSSPSRTEADQALLDCLLDAIRYGDLMSNLAGALETIARDASYLTVIRKNAKRALMHVVPDHSSILLKLAQDIRSGTIEDRDDEMLGVLLSNLYPIRISPEHILDYLHPPKDHNFIGNYYVFWIRELPKKTATDDLPLLLDHLVQKNIALRKILKGHQLNKMAGELLIRGLEAHGDTITDERLHDWLGVGADEYDHTRLEGEHRAFVAQWFADRPSRYKAVIEHGASLCVSQENPFYCMSRCAMRLHGSPAPVDIGIWYLEKAKAEQQNGLAEYYFHRVIHELIRQGGQQDLTLAALEFLESVTSAHPAFESWLEQFISCPIGNWQQEHALQDEKWKSERQRHKQGWVSHFRQHLAAIREGNVHPQILYNLAQAYSDFLYEAQGETPDERLDDFLDGDKELIEAAHSGFRHALNRNDLPTVSEIVELELNGKMHFIRPACLIGMDELYQNAPAEAMQLDDAVLSRLLVFRLSFNIGNDPAWFTALVQERPTLMAEVLLAYALPMLRAGKEHVSGLYPLAYDNAYSEVARLALPQLLEGFPLRARKQQLGNSLTPILKGALLYLNKNMIATVVARKLELGSMDAAQRVYWLACGLIIAPSTYTTNLVHHVGKSSVRRGYLAGFLHDRWQSRFTYTDWPETTLALLVELLAPDCSPDRPTGGYLVIPAMHTADMMRLFINTLSGTPSVTASRELERLLALPDLTHWHNTLQHAVHSQRIARRKATFRPLAVEDVSRTLANLQPASAADLAALTFDLLRYIARKIRDGSTNDYKQYWGYAEGDKKKDVPKSESDCRDALLSDLQVRLGPLGIDAQRESNYADNKRADIRVSFGGTNGFSIPIEIKQNNSPDLWFAIHKQLIPKYARDPGAEEHGIYLVFWFGENWTKPPSDGKKLRSAAELENRLRQTLTPEEIYRIQICVIDCALP